MHPAHVHDSTPTPSYHLQPRPVLLMKPRSGRVFLRVLALVVAASTPSASTPGDLFDEVYARVQQQEARLRTLHARFTETTDSTLLKDPIVATGTLVAEWPTRIRLEYAVPERRTILVDERRLVMITPGRRERFDRDIGTAQKRVRKYFLDKNPEELRRAFAITATRDPRLQDAYRLVMLPQRKQIREGLTELHLWLDAGTLFIRRMMMIFPDGDRRTFDLQDVRINEPVAPGVFDVPAP
jgi:outer membrane lipoprotein-sorting protein